MSAVNILIGADAIQIWTDGALYDADGTLLSINGKVGLLPHLSAAVMVRGPGLAVPLLAQHLGSFPTFDAMVAELGPAVGLGVQRHEAVFGLCAHGPLFHALVAGWSEARGVPEAYRVASDRPDAVETLGALYISPGDEPVPSRIRAEFPGVKDRDLASRPDIWTRIMELQRDLRLEQVAGHGGICAVGGFCQVTTITRDSIETRIVGRWPDRVGERMAA